MARLPFLYLSANVLEVGNGGTPLQKLISGAAITSATSFTAEIWSTGDTPAKIGDTLTLTHQGTPDGYWSSPIAYDHGTSGLTAGLHVKVKLTLDAGAGFERYWEMDGVVEIDKGGTVA